MSSDTARRLSWITYDFGNSAYALIVMSVFFPIYFADYLSSDPSYWGVCVSLSLLLTGVSSPLLGAWADKVGLRKRVFVATILTSAIGTALLGFLDQVGLAVAMLSFAVINAAFGVSLSFYDSFLLTVESGGKKHTLLSCIGWAVGYVGGLFCLAIVFISLKGALPQSLAGYQQTFLVTSAFFLLCSLWPICSLPSDESASCIATDQSSFALVIKTLRNWRENQHIFAFLLAMYLIMDGLMTVVYFVALFTKQELNLELNQIVFLFIVVHVSGIVMTPIFGWLAERFGELELLSLCCVFWIVIVLSILGVHSYGHFILISVLTGAIVGSTPAIARGYLAKIIDPRKRAEFFGFNSFASRVATLFGPLLYGFSSRVWGMRYSVLVIVPFFVLGAILLLVIRRSAPKTYH